jgi:hypothetical protein
MKTQISITDFSFEFSGYGHYKVCYQSPITHIEWHTITNDMQLIDLTKNCENPKIKHLNELKRKCKNYGKRY